MARRPEYQRAIKPGRIGEWPSGADTPEQIASRVSYRGSPLHKTYPSPEGPPAHRADKAKCEQYAQADWPQLLQALQTAIRSGFVSEFRGDFPKRAWIWINGVLHEARLTNVSPGEYHGFPLNDSRHYPTPLERVMEAPRVTIPAN